MSEIRITVLMPIHGESPYLSEAIDSVLNQTIEEFQFILVLDRPSLFVRNYVLEKASTDKRFLVLESSGPGISNALNTGISATTTELIARIDADDVMLPKRLERQLELIDKWKCACVGSQLSVMNASGDYLYDTKYPTGKYKIRRSLRIRNVVAHPSVLIKKALIVQAGGYRSEFNGAEDYDLWLRILKIGTIEIIDETLTKYRINDFQETKKNKIDQVFLDSMVRSINYKSFISYLSKKSALNLNRAIEASGLHRGIYLLTAFVIQPILFIEFLYFILIPRLRSR